MRDIVTFEQMLQNVRTNQSTPSILTAVRRERAFVVRLDDPDTSEPYRSEADELPRFAGVYDRALRPLFVAAATCRVFVRPDQGPLLPRVQDQWRALGLTPEAWLASYHLQAGGELPLSLAGSILDDHRFWWWAVVEHAVAPVVVLPLAAFKPDAVFAMGFDPHRLPGGDGPDPTWPFERATRYAKRITARSERVALVVDSYGAGHYFIKVVSTADMVEALYRTAVHIASFSRSRWARSAPPPG